jgi:uncharacterized membrane-anchored protein
MKYNKLNMFKFILYISSLIMLWAATFFLMPIAFGVSNMFFIPMIVGIIGFTVMASVFLLEKIVNIIIEVKNHEV